MTRIPIDGVSLEVDVVGAGPPLLLLHGFTGTRATWSGQRSNLARSMRVIAVDLLGHGRSDAPVDLERYGIEAQAADMVALLEILDASPATVLGYSMGARIALTMATQQPGHVAALVLESPSAGISEAAERVHRREADERLADAIERDGISAFVEAWEAQPLFASHAALPRATRETIRAERLGQRPEGLARSLRGGGQGAMLPLHARLSRVRCPSLVIAGAADPAGLARAQTVADGLVDARLEVIADAGHTPHLERPAAFKACLSDFLPTMTALVPH